jgi:DNA-binding NarL/FixJ family response regulator
VQEKLRTTGARVHEGKEPPREEAPSSVLLCLEEQDVAPAVLHVQALAPHAPVVVFGPTPDPHLAEEALRAGACGFVHTGMPPERVALALSLASEGEVLIPKGLLGELLGRRLFLRRPMLLDP